MASEASDSVVSSVLDQVKDLNASTAALVTTTVMLSFVMAYKLFTDKKQEDLPPHIPSVIPFLGQAISFGQSPIEFLVAAYEKYGPVFSFTMVGKTFTYLIGSESSALFFNSRNENLNAEEVYGKLTTPVFGKGVAYDVPNAKFLEQKKIFKTGLNVARFRTHVPMIEDEAQNYFERWGDEGQKDMFQALSEVIILTASRCLHGEDIRSCLDEKVAQLYWDLDGGFTPMAWLLPSWLPLPSFRKRDQAHVLVKQMFFQALAKRRESGEIHEDMLQTLMEATYKNGNHLTDNEIAGMCIGLLLAGQHTSSTTTSWLAFFLAKDKKLQDRVYAEQKKVCGEKLPPLTYDDLKELHLLDRCLKESLRLRPPIMTMMRMCKTPQKVMGYTIPPGHQICVSPTTNHRLPDTWTDFGVYNPDRFLDADVANSEKFAYIPFGAGRHRCIGELFAYAQIKTIMSTLIRKYEFELVDGRFPDVDFTTMIHTPKDPIIKYKLRTPTH